MEWPLKNAQKEILKAFDQFVIENKSFLENKKLLVWGASVRGTLLGMILEKKGLIDFLYIDNDERKWGNHINGHSILNPNEVRNQLQNTFILIPVEYPEEICKQLYSWGLKEDSFAVIKSNIEKSYTEEEIQDLTVATDNVEAGRMLGKYARTLLNKDSKIAIVSHVKGVSTAVEREQGFREGLGDYADNIVDVVYCNSLYEKSYELTNELMEKYPDLELIAGMNEYSAVGVGRAVCDAQAKDQIAVVGVDCSQEAINLMEMGVYKGIIVQKAFRMGYMAVEETIHMYNGDAVEKNIDSGCELVTPENMYDSDIERLIFPFN